MIYKFNKSIIINSISKKQLQNLLTFWIQNTKMKLKFQLF
ncbi:hypothetical protein pb186bvf_020940 [Paramecium bursaria]